MKVRYGLIAALITAVLVVIKEWEVLQHLNQVFFGNYYDALKNYYTVLYHIKWDEGYWHFEGMHYPYGEHVLFTDNQPILANFLKLLHQIGLPVLSFIPALLNGLLFFGLSLTSYVSYLCLHKLGVPTWVALIVAVLLAFLSPQVDRISGHFALSYSFIIPLFIYQGLLFIEKPSIKRSALISFLLLFFSFIHAYYLGFAMLIFLVLILSVWVFQKIGLKQALLALLVQVILPFIALQSFMFFTDGVSDRPSHPWSPFLGNYTPHGVFFPIGKPLGHWISVNFGMPHVEWEAITYIGAFASLFFLISCLTLPFLFLKKLRTKHFFYTGNPTQLFLVSISVFSLLVPIVFGLITKSSELYQLLGPVKQFRSVSRFVWIMFFSINFYIFYWFTNQFKRSKPKLYFAILIIGLLLLTQDAYQNFVRPFTPTHVQNLLIEKNAEQLMVQKALSNYDVLIPLPHFHIGSESFVFDRGGGEHLKNAMTVSHASGLPLTSIMLSRTSLSQTIETLKYFIPFKDPEPNYLTHLKGKKVALLLSSNTTLSPHEMLFLEAASDTVLHNTSFTILDVELHTYNQLLIENQHANDTLAQVLTDENYEVNQERAYLGKGCLKIEAKLPRVVDVFPLSETQDSLRVSFWVYLNVDTKPLETVFIEVLDQNKAIIERLPFRIDKHLNLLDGYWGRVEMPISVQPSAKFLKIELGENNLYPTPTYIDGLQIKTP